MDRGRCEHDTFPMEVMPVGAGPDGDGTELIVDLRGANPGVKVLVLSACIEPGLAERAAASRVQGRPTGGFFTRGGPPGKG